MPALARQIEGSLDRFSLQLVYQGALELHHRPWIDLTSPFSTNWNPVFVLGWCWCQFTVGLTQPAKNLIAFPRLELVRQPHH